MKKTRTETDSFGPLEVPAEKYWGAQTQTSKKNFKIGNEASMPLEIIYGFAYLKKAAASTNYELGILSKEKKDLAKMVIIDSIQENNSTLLLKQTENFLIENKYKVSAGYSGNFYDVESGLIDGVIYPALDPSIFEVKFPDSDIKGKVLGDNLGIME